MEGNVYIKRMANYSTDTSKKFEYMFELEHNENITIQIFTNDILKDKYSEIEMFEVFNKNRSKNIFNSEKCKQRPNVEKW